MSISKKDFLDSLAYFRQKLKAEIADGYVGKEAGKGLSTNDYTTAEKEQLANLAASGGGGDESITNSDIDSIFSDAENQTSN